MAWNATAYGEVFARWLKDAPLNELGPGRADQSLRTELNELSLATAFSGQTIRDEDAARCCLAAVWLRYDFLDESHTLSQEIETREGSYWHGIMHRREPDYGNAKYWFRGVGAHPIFAPLATVAAEIAAGSVDTSVKFLQAGDAWDPYRFIDLCAAIARGKSTSESLARQIARAEWELLFEYCHGLAVSGGGK